MATASRVPPIARWYKRSGTVALTAVSHPPSEQAAALSTSLASIQSAYRLPITFSRVALRPIQCCRFSHTNDVFAIVLQGDRSVAIWSFGTASEGTVQLVCTLAHGRPVMHLAWRKKPDQQSQSGVLLTLTDDGVARLWAPVIDDPHSLRLVSVIDPASMIEGDDSIAAHRAERIFSASVSQERMEHGRGTHSRIDARGRRTSPALYLDAADVSAVLQITLDRLRHDLQQSEAVRTTTTGMGSELDHEMDLKRSRTRRLEHLLMETPDLFLCFDQDGTLVIKAVANIDRRPPTLCETFTVLKLYTASSVKSAGRSLASSSPASLTAELTNAGTSQATIRWDQIRSASLVPVRKPLNNASCYDATGLLLLAVEDSDDDSIDDESRKDRTCINYGRALCSRLRVVMLSFSPALLFDGLEAGLQAIDTNCANTHHDLGPNLPMHFGIKEDDKELHARYAGDLLGMMVEKQDEYRRRRRHLPDTDGSRHSNLLSSNKQQQQDNQTSKQYSDPSAEEQCGKSRCSATHKSSRLTATCNLLNPNDCSSQGHSEEQIKSTATADTPSSTAWIVTIHDPGLLFFSPGVEAKIRLPKATCTATKPIMTWSGEDEDVSTRTMMPPSLAIGIGTNLYILAPRRLAQWQTVCQRWTLLAHANLANVMGGPSGSGTVTRQLERISWLTDRQIAVFFTGFYSGPLLLHDCLLVPRNVLTSRHLKGSKDCSRSSSSSSSSLTSLLGSSSSDFDAPAITSSPMTLARLNEFILLGGGPLPDLHAESLIQYMLWGQLGIALATLHDACRQRLSGISTDERLPANETEALHASLASDASMRFLASPAQRKAEAAAVAIDVEQVRSVLSQLDDSNLQILGATALDIRTTAELVFDLRRLAGQLDDFAMYFLVAYTYACGVDERRCHRQRSRREQTRRSDAAVTTTTTTTTTTITVDSQASKRFLFAYHSGTQEALLRHLETIQGGTAQATWPNARRLGVFIWVQADTSVLRWAELIARAQFTAGEERDPSHCALFYYALGKERLMLNLWRQAIWHPDQKKMLSFLQNDFSQPRWRSAALKNAFTLLSQRRFVMAASFFLLGDSLEDAVNVCARNLHDLSLAIALCRIWQLASPPPDTRVNHRRTTGRSVLASLLHTQVLPSALVANNRWLAAWALDMLQQPDLALHAVSRRLDSLGSAGGPREHLSLLNTSLPMRDVDAYSDPEALLMFKFLLRRRAVSVASLPSASSDDNFNETLKIEAQLVAHAVRTMRRNGAYGLAVGLAAGWTFEFRDRATAVTRSSSGVGKASAKNSHESNPPTSASSMALQNKKDQLRDQDRAPIQGDVAFDLDSWDM